MEEMENDGDTDVGDRDGVGDRERRAAGAAAIRPSVGVNDRVQTYAGNVLVGGRRSRRQPVTADDIERRHGTDTKGVMLADARDIHGLEADTYDEEKNSLHDEISTRKAAGGRDSEGYTDSTACQGMCIFKTNRGDSITTDLQHLSVNDSGHVGDDGGGVAATEDVPSINTVSMVTVPLLSSVRSRASLERISHNSHVDEVTSPFPATESVTDEGVTMSTGGPGSGRDKESDWVSSKATVPQTEPVTARDALQAHTISPSLRQWGEMHSNRPPYSTTDIAASLSSNKLDYKLTGKDAPAEWSSHSTSHGSTASPDFLLLHKPRPDGTGVSWVNGVRLKYNVIDVNKNTEGKEQESWIFHAMINPGMIPVQTRLINLQEKLRHRMMPFEGEIVRGKSKGERNPELQQKEPAKSDAEMEMVDLNAMSDVDMNSPGKLRPGLSGTDDTRGVMKEVVSSKGEKIQPNVRNVPRTDTPVLNTVARGQNQGETILSSRDENLGEDPAYLGKGVKGVLDHPPLVVDHPSRGQSDESSKDIYLVEDAEDDSFEDLDEEHPQHVGWGSTDRLRYELPGTGQLVQGHQPQQVLSGYRKWDSHVGMLRHNGVLKGNGEVRGIGNGERGFQTIGEGDDSVGRGVKPAGNMEETN